MKPTTEHILNSHFFLHGLRAWVPPFESGKIAAETTRDELAHPHGRQHARPMLAALIEVAADLALSEAAPEGATWSVGQTVLSYLGQAMHRATATADVSALDWASSAPQTMTVELKDNGGATVASATMTVTLNAQAGG